MATEQAVTEQSNGHTNVRGAASLIDSMLAAEEAGTQHPVAEAKPAKSPTQEAAAELEEAEVDEEQVQEGEQEVEEAEAKVEGDEEEEAEEQPKGDEADDDHVVEIDGKKVTVKELKRGFLREADYTRKTQKLADDRRLFEEGATVEAKALRTERGHLAEALKQTQEMLQALLPQEPNWTELLQRDPQEFAVQKQLWNDFQTHLQRVENQRAYAAHRDQEQAQAEFNKRVASSQKQLLEKIPEWSDKSKAKAEVATMMDYAKDLGFSEAELASIDDHRTMLVLRDAARYRALMKQKSTMKPVQVKGPRTVAPGAIGKEGKVNDLSRAKQRLAKTGNVRDAQSVFEQMLAYEERKR
jgi:hypothetical protein